MTIDLTSVFTEEGKAVPLEYELLLDDVELGGIKPLRQPIKISTKAVNRTGIVTLTGSIRVILEAPCDRCAADYASDFEIPVYHTLVQVVHNEETEDMVLIPDAKLDADELFRCDVLLGLPVKHLCSEDCRGVCVGCGKNLNKEQCGCKKTIDPRFQALSDLLEEE